MENFEDFSFDDFGDEEIQDQIKNDIITNYIIIQKELFVTSFINFYSKLEKTDSELNKRASEYAKDFNNITDVDIIKNFGKSKKAYGKIIRDFNLYSNYIFDHIDYIRKINKEIYDSCILHSRKIITKQKSMKFFNHCAECTINSIDFLLEVRDKSEKK